MSKELFINSTDKGERIALLENKSLIELHLDNHTNFSVGDLYLGLTRKVVPGLNAAFVDVGYHKDAFLHYLDLSPNFLSLKTLVKQAVQKKKPNTRLQNFKRQPELNKFGKINEVLKPGNLVLVQVAKEPISSKGPRLTCEISLAGRYLVLVPFSDVVNVSKKITSVSERKRLSRLVSSIKPENFGVIIRTVAESKDVAELDRDLRDLVQKWEEGIKSLEHADKGHKIISEQNRAESVLRDMLNESFDSITVDSSSLYKDIKDYIKRIAPDKEKIVKKHKSKTKLFEAYGIEKQIKLSFGKKVSLKSGGHLIIEHTEALHVVDVNSGNKSIGEENQEATALSVNQEAIVEVAKQLRLRDIGGIIIVDFIDMKEAQNRKQIYDLMRAELKKDDAKSTPLPLSKFGLMQITRQRFRPELSIPTKEKCPTCNGTGEIDASISVSDQVEFDLKYILEKQNETTLTLYIHPFLYSYFTKGLFSIQWKWFFRYKKWVKLVPDSSIGLSNYFFENNLGQVISLD